MITPPPGAVVLDPARFDSAPQDQLPQKIVIVCGSGVAHSPMSSIFAHGMTQLVGMAMPSAGDASVVEKWLREEGGNVNATTGAYSETMLMLASAQGHEAIVITCLQHGANVNQLASDGVAALSRAAMYARTSIFRRLLEAKSDVNHIGKFMNSALCMRAPPRSSPPLPSPKPCSI